MNTEELFLATLGLVLGIGCLVTAYRATQTGEITGPEDGPSVFNSRKEPGEFTTQMMAYIIGGLFLIGVVVWNLYRTYWH